MTVSKPNGPISGIQKRRIKLEIEEKRKKFEKRRAAKADSFGGFGGQNLGFGAGCRLMNSLVFGDWGGFISGLRRLSNGFVSVLSMGREFSAPLFPSAAVHGNASESKAKKCRRIETESLPL